MPEVPEKQPKTTKPGKKALRKALISGAITLFILIAGGLLVQRFMLPRFIVNALEPETEPSVFIPDRVKPTLYKARKEMAEHIDYVPQMLDSVQMTVDDLVAMIDRMDNDHIANAIDELKETELTSQDQVFDIMVRNIPVEGHDLEIFRYVFKERISLNKVKRALRKFDSPIATTLMVPVVKETAKQLLHNNRHEIHATLDSLQGN